MKRNFLLMILPLLMLLFSGCGGPRDGKYTFRILTTNDVHGCYFDSVYVGDRTKNSLLAVSYPWQSGIMT